jgi:phage terminase small subunit
MMAPRTKPLTPRMERFVSEYLIDLNATQAAVRAGYGPAAAEKASFRLLRLPEVRRRVQEAEEARRERNAITADRIRAELARVAFANLADLIRIQPDGAAVIDLTDATRQQLAALGEITVDEYTEGRGDAAREVKRVKVKLHDKLGALDKLAKIERLYVERVEHSGPGGAPIAFDTIRRVIVDPKTPAAEG